MNTNRTILTHTPTFVEHPVDEERITATITTWIPTPAEVSDLWDGARFEVDSHGDGVRAVEAYARNIVIDIHDGDHDSWNKFGEGFEWEPCTGWEEVVKVSHYDGTDYIGFTITDIGEEDLED
jgi:hypothetical protein